jgi:hypothetical protein
MWLPFAWQMLITTLAHRTLTSIHEFMKIQCDAKWTRRFMQKASIDNDLMDYTSQLNDAAQSFQVHPPFTRRIIGVGGSQMYLVY